MYTKNIKSEYIFYESYANTAILNIIVNNYFIHKKIAPLLRCYLVNYFSYASFKVARPSLATIFACASALTVFFKVYPDSSLKNSNVIFSPFSYYVYFYWLLFIVAYF